MAADWPQWGGTDCRNFASDEKGIPESFNPGKKNVGGVGFDLSTGTNIKWIAKLGNQTYGNPTVSNGRVFVGTNGVIARSSTKVQREGGAVMCFDEATGKLLWQLLVPRYMTNDRNFNFDDMSLGIRSSPTVDGDRVYLVSNRDEVLCLDVNGVANGNDGPFQDEAQYMAGPGNPPEKIQPTDGDIIWRVDMLTHPEIKCWPQDAVDCSIIVRGDYLYLSPSNGVDRSHVRIPSPNCPTLIVLDKKTGKLIATDEEKISPHIFHGTWSAPSIGKINGKDVPFFGGPDGFCYAFDPDPVTAADGKKVIKTLWKCDVNPAERRFLKDGTPAKYKGNKNGPSECIATPVFYKNRVYIAVGQDPRHGKSGGYLSCIDATKTGDITKTGLLWTYSKIDRSLSTVSIYDGLLFVADFSGYVHCLDPDTGKPYWVFNTEAPIWGSTYAADGKVWIGTERCDLFVLAASKEMKLLRKITLDNKIYTTPIVANGTLYCTSQTYLYAVKQGASR